RRDGEVDGLDVEELAAHGLTAEPRRRDRDRLGVLVAVGARARVDEAEREVVVAGGGGARNGDSDRPGDLGAGGEGAGAEDLGALGRAAVPVVVELEAGAVGGGPVVADGD